MSERADRMAWYSNYLKSPHWLRRRAWALDKLGAECELCGADEEVASLHVHHLNYDHVWNEDVFDLAVLCNQCHRDAHQYSQLEGIARSLTARRHRVFGVDHREAA